MMHQFGAHPDRRGSQLNFPRHRAWTAWKYAMWESGCKLPTQLASGQSRCFCGAVIDIKGMSQHVQVAPHGSRMKFVEPSPFIDPDAAARKLVEIANAIEPVQDGWLWLHESGTFLKFTRHCSRNLHRKP
jgi:hypothetical protein